MRDLRLNMVADKSEALLREKIREAGERFPALDWSQVPDLYAHMRGEAGPDNRILFERVRPPASNPDIS